MHADVLYNCYQLSVVGVAGLHCEPSRSPRYVSPYAVIRAVVDRGSRNTNTTPDPYIRLQSIKYQICR